MTWQPIPGHIMTRWAKDVTPVNTWQEYPRPQMTRPKWLNLNGLWEYVIAPKTQDIVPEFHGQILVPFPIESALSGVKYPLQSNERLWYRRIFSVPTAWRGKRILLHFGAVDWETKVILNGCQVGEHTGGYLPFWFNITDVVENGENELVLSVWDPTDDYWQQRGKQVLKPKSIWYTAVSGIWQTVWLEPVPEKFIAGIKITPDVDSATLKVKVNLAGIQTGTGEIRVRVLEAGVLITAGETDSVEAEIHVAIPNPKLWSPDLPYLYEL